MINNSLTIFLILGDIFLIIATIDKVKEYIFKRQMEKTISKAILRELDKISSEIANEIQKMNEESQKEEEEKSITEQIDEIMETKRKTTPRKKATTKKKAE